MKTFTVTYRDQIQAETEEQAWDELLTYLKDCVRFEDVTGFEFTETQPPTN